jgi:hypothetical protein
MHDDLACQEHPKEPTSQSLLHQSIYQQGYVPPPALYVRVVNRSRLDHASDQLLVDCPVLVLQEPVRLHCTRVTCMVIEATLIMQVTAASYYDRGLISYPGDEEIGFLNRSISSARIG